MLKNKMEDNCMKKKFVMAVAAVAMAAVVGVSAFAATGVTVPSITGGSDTASTIVAPSSDDASETTKMVYKTIVSTEGNTEEKLAAVVGEETVAQAGAVGGGGAAAVAGVETVEDLSIRAVGDVNVDSKTGEVAVTVTGMEDGDTAVVLYQDANGNWVAIKAVVVNGKLTFKMPKSGTIILLTHKA